MEESQLEKKSEQKRNGSVKATCLQTGKVLLIPRELYERVERKDKSIADKSFDGFYISPRFNFYETQSAFNDFCSD